MACLNIQLTNQSIMLINFHNVYYIPLSMANLVSGNSLFKKSFYFHGSKCTLNWIFDDKEVAYALMINGLFLLKIIYTSLVTLSSWDSAFMWHWWLGYIGLDSLKKVLEERLSGSQRSCINQVLQSMCESQIAITPVLYPSSGPQRYSKRHIH